MSSNAIVLSIRPQFADKILKGTKTVELRRVYPRRIGKGDRGLIYASSPVKSLVGGFEIARIVEKPLNELWEMRRLPIE